MRKTIYILGFILIKLVSFSQELVEPVKTTSFPVSKVEIATYPLEEVDYKSALETSTNSKIESYPLKENNRKLVATNAHSFISTLHLGFAQHRPIAISPDMIWLLITQGAAIHIESKSEQLRKKLVNFKGSKQLRIQRNEFVKGDERNDWASVFPQFSDSIRKYMNDSIYNLFVPNFSTTTTKERNAYEIAFMSSVNNYFDYSSETFCGIPEIILEGTTSDWTWIVNNCSNLEKLGLNDWSDNLKPILTEFVNASKGEIDTIFWQSMYKWCGISGGPIVTGWIIKFFPYIYVNNKLTENPFLNGNRYAYSGLRANNFPSGLSKVDMRWKYYDQNFKMYLYSGFMGVAQDKITKVLRPEITWAIRDSNSKILKEKFEIVIDTVRLEDTTFIVEYLKNKESIIDTLRVSTNIDLRRKKLRFFQNLKRRGKTNFAFPNIFPNTCNTFHESLTELNNYISIKLENKQIEYNGNVSFTITWYGSIDNVKIIQSDNPEYDDKIISIIEKITSCQPGIYSNKLTNIEIGAILKIR